MKLVNLTQIWQAKLKVKLFWQSFNFDFVK